MQNDHIHAVTGAFGYSGRYIAAKLLEEGREVITLTNTKPARIPFEGRVRASPLSFDDPEALVRSLSGVEVLYNTYWVRFNYGSFSHDQAVKNTLVLFDAAKRAGVARIVHVSITNPSEASSLEYFSGKARLERALEKSGIEYSILRPTVLFGREDILINNIAWALRRFPFFAVFGDGKYRLQPIYVDDFAALAVREGKSDGRHVVNAIGPETFTYEELVKAVGRAIRKERPIVHVSPEMGYRLSRFIGRFVNDVFITREEIQGLMEDLLYVDAFSAGPTRLTDWMRANAETLGKKYASELGRRRDQ